jgi:riboflavin synthase
MFTGIVEEVGSVRSLVQEGESVTLSVACSVAREGLALGDSVSIEGTCLTVTSLDQQGFTVGLAPETLRRTNLAELHEGARVNLERAVRVGDRMGGHYVQGHVDGVTRILRREPEGDSLLVTFELPPDLARYVVEKGFVALDGASLTVARRDADSFAVALIAYTREHIALADKPVGGQVNVEVDIVAKYVESILAGRTAEQPA